MEKRLADRKEAASDRIRENGGRKGKNEQKWEKSRFFIRFFCFTFGKFYDIIIRDAF